MAHDLMSRLIERHLVEHQQLIIVLVLAARLAFGQESNFLFNRKP